MLCGIYSRYLSKTVGLVTRCGTVQAEAWRWHDFFSSSPAVYLPCVVPA